jgi:hypothetical protein
MIDLHEFATLYAHILQDLGERPGANMPPGTGRVTEDVWHMADTEAFALFAGGDGIVNSAHIQEILQGFGFGPPRTPLRLHAAICHRDELTRGDGRGEQAGGGPVRRAFRP